ncbi:hypothetical protein Brutus_00039 [Acinetobacter phage Brutus]|nr:hypothetical protein Brutus_00039 [Acinetobacter phage Brutus]
MNYNDVFNMVENKYQELRKSENGVISRLDVIKITSPQNMIDDFYYTDIKSYWVRAVDLVEKIFPNAQIAFENVDDISITYNLVKTF